MTKLLEALKQASKYYTGWRPALGWVAVLGCLVAFVINPLVDLFDAVIDGRNPASYDTQNLMLLVPYALGTSIIRFFDKKAGQATVDDEPYVEASTASETKTQSLADNEMRDYVSSVKADLSSPNPAGAPWTR